MQHLLPPILWFVCLVAIGITYAYSADLQLAAQYTLLVGGALFVVGALVTIAASRQFAAVRTNINTFLEPDKLVTSGLFRFSRNPMYLGFLITLAGGAVAANSAYAFLPVALFFAASQLWYIPYEERMATAVFGDSYAEYCRKVRRWI